MDEPLKPMTLLALMKALETAVKHDGLVEPGFILEAVRKAHRERQNAWEDHRQHLDKLWALVERWRADAREHYGEPEDDPAWDCAEDLAEALRAGSGYDPRQDLLTPEDRDHIENVRTVSAFFRADEGLQEVLRILDRIAPKPPEGKP